MLIGAWPAKIHFMQTELMVYLCISFLSVTIPINHTVAVKGSENTTTIDVREYVRAHTRTHTHTHTHTHAHTQIRMHTQTHEYDEFFLKPRPSTCDVTIDCHLLMTLFS